MAVKKTLKGQTVITVVCNIVYNEPEETKQNDNKDDEALINHFQKMASAWRVVTFFLIVFVVPVILIALPLYARYTLYPPQTLELMPSDTVDLHGMTSSFWCQGQRVSGNGTFDSFLLDEMPQLNKKRRKQTAANSVMKITEEQPEVKVLHLLKGSTFKLGICARWPGATIIVVRGIKNFNKCYYKEERDHDDSMPNIDGNKKTSSEIRRFSPKFLTIRVPSTTESSSVEGETQRNKSGGRLKKMIGVLPPTNADVFEEESNSNGGEVIDEEDLDIKSPSTESLSLDVGKLSPITKVVNKVTSKSKTTDISIDQSQNEIPYSEWKLDNSVTHKNTSAKLSRPARSIGRRDDYDGSDENRREEEEAMKKLGLLHSVNDTRDVTAGNSSYSSSEEFMEQCTETILNLAPKHFNDCQSRNVGLEASHFFKVNETDDYYIIFMSDNSLEENVLKYHLEIDRVMYNVSDSLDVCSNNTECIFPIHFMSSEGVVVEMNDQIANATISQLHSYEMQAFCQPRVAVYMAFILLVPFIILMFAFQ